METNLDKNQLQVTLREMGVKFSADLDESELKKLLQKENNNQWIRSAREGGAKSKKIILRTGKHPRHRTTEPQESYTSRKPHVTSATHLPNKKEKSSEPFSKHVNSAKFDTDRKNQPRTNSGVPRIDTFAPHRDRRNEDIFETGSLDIPDSDKSEQPCKPHTSSNIFDPSKNIEAYALERANGICDLCQKETNRKDNESAPGLFPYIFSDPYNAERRTVKNAAALCSECIEKVKNNCSNNDIKILKRKARGKRHKEIKIGYRKTRGAHRRL